MMDASVGLVRLERSVGITTSQLGKCGAFPGFDLALVLCELAGVEAGGEAGEGAAGVDLGQLMMVPDQHDLGVCSLGVGEESCEGAGADHGRLVHHDDRA